MLKKILLQSFFRKGRAMLTNPISLLLLKWQLKMISIWKSRKSSRSRPWLWCQSARLKKFLWRKFEKRDEWSLLANRLRGANGSKTISMMAMVESWRLGTTNATSKSKIASMMIMVSTMGEKILLLLINFCDCYNLLFCRSGGQRIDEGVVEVVDTNNYYEWAEDTSETLVTIKQFRQSYTTIKIYIIMKVAFLHEKKSLHDLLLN